MDFTFSSDPQSSFEGTAPSPPPLSVSQISRQIRGVLEERFSTVRVQGEVIGLARPRSGHVYFNLKDDGQGEVAGDAKIAAVMWKGPASRLRFPLEDGIRVIATGRVTVYEPRGSYQLIVDRIEPAGKGTLLQALEKLKKKLFNEGLFDPEKKLPLPWMPRTVGLITSPTGAAVQDVLRSLQRKFPVHVKIYPAKVQGEGSGREIVRAIQLAEVDPQPVDVLIIARGGGSLEDLWTFNEEPVVRAVSECTLPTVSGVGHEIDTTLVDLAASVRAQTPTHAGELVVPDFQAIVDELLTVHDRIFRGIQALIEAQSRRLIDWGGRLQRSSPEKLLVRRKEQLKSIQLRMHAALEHFMLKRESHLNLQAEKLGALNPYQVFQRGFSATRFEDGKFVRDAKELSPGQRLKLILARGEAQVEVREVLESSPLENPLDLKNEESSEAPS